MKAVSFISRLMGAAKKKEAEQESLNDESSNEEQRPEGNDAEVFAQPTDNIGFQPQHPAPPAYIKVRSRFKKERDFDRLFLAQELRGHVRPTLERQDTGASNKLRRKVSAQPSDANTIWAMSFSKDGKYLAAAGADMTVRIWSVLSNLDERHQLERHESKENEAFGNGSHAEHLSAPVFQSRPVREYEGHTATVLDLSWSKNNFLLSSSMDKTVRLWHVSRAECLCTFKHHDFVPSISFHPKDDRFFLAGSLDSKLRLWSIPDKAVAYSAQLPDMITAVAFTPDGKHAMAGCLGGLCMFFETDGLRYQTQINVRSSRGQNAKGSKITGIQTLYGSSGDVKVLITSNDSRIRLYNFRDKSLELKFRGGENNYSQIRASVNDDGRYVVCGSEDSMAYIWSLDHPQNDKRDKTPVEMFEAHDSITTVVCMAPMRTRQALGRSEDPVYDVCNPPLVSLLSQGERDSKPPTENGSVQHTPSEPDSRFEKPKESASYLNRAQHRSGHIIVTADYLGRIKVFRQDCGWSKRRQDDWDKSSIFTKRSGKLSRTASFATRTSQRSLNEKRNSTSTQAPLERINMWRQGIATYPSPGIGLGRKKDGSISPRARRSLDRRPKTEARATDSAKSLPTHPLATDVLVRSPSPIENDPMDSANPDSPKTPPRQSENPLAIVGGSSYAYWDVNNIKQQAQQARRIHENSLGALKPLTPILSPNEVEGDPLDASRRGSAGGSTKSVDHDHLAVRPVTMEKQLSYVSRLSDERSSLEEDHFDDARSHHEEEDGEQMRCTHCKSISFAAHSANDGMAMRLVCMDCGLDALRGV